MSSIFSMEGVALMTVIGGLAYWSERRLIANNRAESNEKPAVAAWVQGMRRERKPDPVKSDAGKHFFDGLIWLMMSFLLFGLSAVLLILALPFIFFVLALFGVALAV